MDVKLTPTTERGTRSDPKAFTLIELLVVIMVIAILTALLFPAFRAAQDQAKRMQAKNDVTQIVTAVNAFYTEYGQYPDSTGASGVDYFAADDENNKALFDVLRGDPDNDRVKSFNPKAIMFLQPTIAKDPDHPKGGIGGNGKFYDPWGWAYRVEMDTSYDSVLTNPYQANTGAGFDPIQLGVIGWSLGSDGDGAKNSTEGNGGPKNKGVGNDDVISWQ
jgi:prepilin-type N-terminal cleavage/methylation domain-containing protein